MRDNTHDPKTDHTPSLIVGYFNSAIGGAPGAIIQDHSLLFEIITAGAVYDPSGQQLCGPGWIFAHRQGQSTIHKTKPKGKYSCLTLRFADQGKLKEVDWPRAFHWSPNHSATASVVNFAEEMLEAYHRTNIDRAILSELALSQLRFRLAQFQQSKTASSYPAEIAKVTEYIDRHHREEITMGKLADLAELSVSHLHTRFKSRRRYPAPIPHPPTDAFRLSLAGRQRRQHR